MIDGTNESTSLLINSKGNMERENLKIKFDALTLRLDALESKMMIQSDPSTATPVRNKKLLLPMVQAIKEYTRTHKSIYKNSFV